MWLLKHIRSRSKLKEPRHSPVAAVYPTSYDGPDLASKLPANVLSRIFTYLCPHIGDDAYTTCEESMTEDGCMLCSTRDLARSSRVCKSWSKEAQRALYHNVRLDAVHYCAREDELAEKRRRKSSLFDRNGVTQDPAQERLELFSSTVRANSYLGSLVEILKVPYMTRETCKADLARAVSALPNLRYVDLPEGLFGDEPSSATLREELRHSCPDLRRMKYSAGAENSFAMLAQTRLWHNLRVLELDGLAVEPDVLLYGLASFPTLQELHLRHIKALDDSVFETNANLPLFPPVRSLVLRSSPSVTATGLVTYLSRSQTREALMKLCLADMNIPTQDIHTILAAAPQLKDFTIHDYASQSFPLSQVPPLQSPTLSTLSFEILPSSSEHSAAVESHYSYLAISLLSGSLPNLTSLFAYCPSLPDLLLLEAPTVHLNGLSLNSSPRATFIPRGSIVSAINGPFPERDHTTLPLSSALTGLKSPLKLYTKPASAPELEWSVTTIDPPSERDGRKGSMSATRPLSAVLSDRSSSLYSAKGGGGRWSDEARHGGFLAVPGEGINGDDGEAGHRRKGSRGSDTHRAGEWMGSE